MLAKIGWYVLFLIALVIYFTLVAKAQKKQERVIAQTRGSVFIANQFVIAAGLLPIVVIPWILTGFFSRPFLVLIVVAFEVSALLTHVSYYLFRLTPRLVGMRYTLSSAELLLKHPYLMILALVLFGFGILGSYFLIATYVYVTNPLHSENAVRLILLLNLGLFVGGGAITAIPNIAQIASPQINDRTRAAFFLSQIATALQIGVMLTVYMGLAGVGVERFLPASLVLPAGYSQYVPMVVLTALYLVLLVVPYFVGLEGRRRAEISLNTTILEEMNKIIDVIGIPGEDDLNQLRQLRDGFVVNTNDWIETEPIIKEVAMKIDRPGAVEELDPSLQPLVEPYRAFKDQDLRFVKLSWTDGMKLKFEEMIDEYNRYAAQPNRVRMFIRLGQAFGEYFRDQRQRYESKLKEAEERKIITPVLARLVPVLGAVPVVVQYGERLITILPLKP
jgi:hypothetical protein